MSTINAVELGPTAAELLTQVQVPDAAPSRHAAAVAAAGSWAGQRFVTEAAAIRAILGPTSQNEAELTNAVCAALRPVSAPGPTVPTPFPTEAIDSLGVYVYALVDPRNNRPFYVGKGRGNRVFQHAWGAIGNEPSDSSEVVGPADTAAVTSAKNARIQAIFADGFGVEHWIIRHRINEDPDGDRVAFAAEQSIIDYARLAGSGLVNIQGGHVSTEHRMETADELALRYSAEPVPPLPFPCALIKVNAASRPDATPEAIYAWGREAWIAGARARAIESLPILIFADDIVRAVHRAEQWELVAETTPSNKLSKAVTRWWRFTGDPDPELEVRYVGKSLREVRARRRTGGWQQHGWHPYLAADIVDDGSIVAEGGGA